MEKVIEKIMSGDLYSLLSVCSNDELKPLVDIILGASTNFLDIDDKYKENKPNHKAYYKIIADEIRLFGSNSFSSIFRGGEGVSYDEVLLDVCEKLAVPCKKNATVYNESNLFDLYNLEKEKYGNTGSIGSTLKLIATLLISRVTPVGFFLLPVQIASPAFRVTVPCVIHIACLRQKKIKEFHEKKSANNDIVEASESNQDLFFIESDGNKVIAFKEISDPLDEKIWTENNNDKVSSLNPLLQNIPSLATAENVKRSRYMEVFIDGDLAKVAGSGDKYRGWALDAKGKFSEHAELTEVSNLSKLVNFSSAFQIASTVVAQKHLADINEKLESIKNCLNTISDFLKNERKSKILGTIEYFEQISQTVFDDACPDFLLNQIEAKEAELISIQSHLIEDITSLSAKRDHSDTDTFGTESFVSELSNCQKETHLHYHHLLLCVKARACGWQLLSNSRGKEALVMNRKKDILKVVESLDNGKLLKVAEETLKFNLDKVSSFFNAKSTLNERKLKVLKENKNLISFVDKEVLSLKEGIVRAEALINDSSNSKTKILLKVEGDKVVSTSVAC